MQRWQPVHFLWRLSNEPAPGGATARDAPFWRWCLLPPCANASVADRAAAVVIAPRNFLRDISAESSLALAFELDDFASELALAISVTENDMAC